MMGVCGCSIADNNLGGSRFGSGSIYDNEGKIVRGVVDIVTPAESIIKTTGIFIRVKGDDGKHYGGMIYRLSNSDFAYKSIRNIASIAYLTKSKVNLCYKDVSRNFTYVYAISLTS